MPAAKKTKQAFALTPTQFRVPNLTLVHVFWLWKETGGPVENPHRKSSGPGIEPTTFLLSLNIHPSILYATSYTHDGSAGASPSGHGAKAGVHPREVIAGPLTKKEPFALTHLRGIQSSQLASNACSCKRKLNYQERSHPDTGRTCKLYTERPQDWTHNLLTIIKYIFFKNVNKNRTKISGSSCCTEVAHSQMQSQFPKRINRVNFEKIWLDIWGLHRLYHLQWASAIFVAKTHLDLSVFCWRVALSVQWKHKIAPIIFYKPIAEIKFSKNRCQVFWGQS